MTEMQTPKVSGGYKGITKENAIEMSRLATQARLEKRLARELAENIGVLPKIIGSVAPMLSPLVPLVKQGDEFREETLIHVRDEIRSTLERLKEEDDPKARESLSRSLGVLLEHEGHLSGRPKSGVMKPSSKPSRKPSTTDATDPFEG